MAFISKKVRISFFSWTRNLSKSIPAKFKKAQPVKQNRKNKKKDASNKLKQFKLFSNTDGNESFIDAVLFQRANNLINSSLDQAKAINSSQFRIQTHIVVGIDITLDEDDYNTRVTYSPLGTRLTKFEFGGEIKEPIVFNNQIGALMTFLNNSELNEKDEKFIRIFHLVIKYSFKLLGKKFNELREEDLKVPDWAEFKIVDKNKQINIYFNDEKSYPTELIISKYFEYLFKSIISNNFVITEVCICLPNEFASRERLALNQCMFNISKGYYKKYSFISRPIGITVGTHITYKKLTTNVDDTSVLVIDLTSELFATNVSFNKSTFDNKIKIDVRRALKDDDLVLDDELFDSSLTKSYFSLNESSHVLIKSKEFLTTPDYNNTIHNNKLIQALNRGNLLNLDLIREVILYLPENTDRSIVNRAKFLLRRTFPRRIFHTCTDPNRASAGATILLALKRNYNLSIYDLLPKSIGISLYNGTFVKILNKKSKYPINGSYTFKTIRDYQPTMRFFLYEGESFLVRNSNYIGEVIIKDLPLLPAGKLECELIMRVNMNGCIETKAFNKKTNQQISCEFNKNDVLNEKFNQNFSDKLEDETKDFELYNMLNELDAFIENILMEILPKINEEEARVKLQAKVAQARIYIGKNSFKITLEECFMLKEELEEELLIHGPDWQKTETKME